jgi:flagellar motor switch protein FliN
MVNQASALLAEVERANGVIAPPIDAGPAHALRGFHQAADYDLAADANEREDVEECGQLDLRIELGRARLELDDVPSLRNGSVVVLDGPASEPAAIYAGSNLVGRGEVVIVDGKIGVRVTEILEP